MDFSDGRCVEGDITSLDADLAGSSASRMVCDFDAKTLLLETTRGDQVTAELPLSGTESRSDTRPVIYLDQNHWTTLANVAHDVGRVPATEVEPARRIFQAAVEQRIRLPLSAAHITETGKWADQDARYRISVVMLKLSRGWQMRDPIDLRHSEIRQALESRLGATMSPSRADVFTLEPNVLYGPFRHDTADDPDDDAVGEARLILLLSSFSALFDTLLHDEHVVPGDVSGWVAKVQRFTEWIASEDVSDEVRTRRTNALFIEDFWEEISRELLRLRVSPDSFLEWLKNDSDADIRAMPSVGLYREVFREKLLNPGTRWEANDLVDLVYLTCGAAYADYMVGENSLTAAAERALRRLGRPQNVHRNLASLVSILGL